MEKTEEGEILHTVPLQGATMCSRFWGLGPSDHLPSSPRRMWLPRPDWREQELDFAEDRPRQHVNSSHSQPGFGQASGVQAAQPTGHLARTPAHHTRMLPPPFIPASPPAHLSSTLAGRVVLSRRTSIVRTPTLEIMGYDVAWAARDYLLTHKHTRTRTASLYPYLRLYAMSCHHGYF
jgi:hypothetical protein